MGTMFGQQQPLATLPPHHASPRAVGFGTVPRAYPGALSFGFGTNSLIPPPSSTFAASPQASPRPRPFSSQTPFASTSATVATPPSSARRRRRSVTPETDDEDAPVNSKPGPATTRRLVSARGKKARVQEDAEDVTLGQRPLNHSALGSSSSGIDLAKALTHMSQPALVSLLSSLLSANPALRPSVEALLPPPTLPDTLSQLAALERAVLASLPSGTGSRSDYVWSRVRTPLEAYCSDTRAFLIAYCGPPSAISTSSSALDELHHPSTTFAFLHSVTLSLARLSASLPTPHPPSSPLPTHLALLLQAWDSLFKKVHGKVLSLDMVTGWFEKAEAMVVAPGGVGERVGLPVRDRLRAELGWLIGYKEAAEAMEEEL